MTREEEITKAAKIFHASSDDYTVYKKGFEAGAEWADQHPKEGLWDAQKVIKYINEVLPNYVELNCVFDEIQVNYNKFKNNFIHNLKKAMEG